MSKINRQLHDKIAQYLNSSGSPSSDSPPSGNDGMPKRLPPLKVRASELSPLRRAISQYRDDLNAGSGNYKVVVAQLTRILSNFPDGASENDITRELRRQLGETQEALTTAKNDLTKKATALAAAESLLNEIAATGR
jgi:hypothetical protein